MIGRIENLTNYSLVDNFVTGNLGSIPFYGAKFNLSFAILLFFYLIFRRNTSWKHIPLLAFLAIPFLHSDQILFETFTPSSDNPQTPHIMLLIFSASVLTLMACVKKTRTLPRIFGSIVALALVAAFLIIHAATINIKLKEQVAMIMDAHFSVFNATFQSRSSETFLYYCEEEKIHCLTSLPTEKDKETIKQVLGGLSDRAFKVIDSGDEYIQMYSLDIQKSAFIFMYGKVDDTVRLIIDFDNLHQAHRSCLIVMYVWYFIISSLWLYGGLFLYCKHISMFQRRTKHTLSPQRPEKIESGTMKPQSSQGAKEK
ncbi:hypothetical protein [Photobacterium galatheae]|nr:hypothetical protein [Photobacterium galatheae]MCM0149047.1 hypothetical protein [Photobacterium galatheae]